MNPLNSKEGAMLLILGMFLAVAMLWPTTAPAIENGEPVNAVEAEYLEAKATCAALTGFVERAECLEAFAQKEAKAHSRTTGLAGQVNGLGNHPPAEAWAWNNAAHCWFEAGCAKIDSDRATAATYFERSVKAYQQASLCEAIDAECARLVEKGTKAAANRKAEAESPPTAKRKTSGK